MMINPQNLGKSFIVAFILILAAALSFPASSVRAEELSGEPSHYMSREEFCVMAAKLLPGDDSPVAINLPFVDTEKIKLENMQYIALLYNKGILSGSSDGGRLYMHPGDRITRQDAVSLLGRLLEVSSEYEMSFTDNNEIAQYAYKYVAWFVEREIITGYPDLSFKPLNNITNGEGAIIAVKTMSFQKRNKMEIITVAGQEAADIPMVPPRQPGLRSHMGFFMIMRGT